MQHHIPAVIDTDGYTLRYKPQICRRGALVGMEALLRRKIRSNSVPEPVAGTAPWALREACRQKSEWSHAHGPNGIRRISVGIGPQQLFDPDFAPGLRQALDEAALDPSELELEFPAGLLAEGGEALSALQQLKALGITLAAEVCGPSQADLDTLRHFPIDTLKLRGFDSDANTSHAISNIVGVARSLKLQVAAAGIETEAQLSLLRRHGCDYYQGGLISDPLPAQVMLGLMREHMLLFDTGEPHFAYG